MKRFFLNIAVIESPNADDRYDVYVNGTLIKANVPADVCSDLTVGELDEMYEFRDYRKEGENVG